MLYNLYIKTRHSRRTLLGLSEDETRKVANEYKEKKESIFLNGKKFTTGELLDFQIYTIENHGFENGEQIFKYCKSRNLLETGYFMDPYVPKNILEMIGSNVTTQFINDAELEEMEAQTEGGNYIDPARIKEIEKLVSNEFDFTRLIAVLNEINKAYESNLRFAIPPLVRSVIDQVPPIFGKANFADVCGSQGTKLFRDNLNI